MQTVPQRVPHSRANKKTEKAWTANAVTQFYCHFIKNLAYT